MGSCVNDESGVMKSIQSGKGYYEIRLESVGGMGANLCGKMLGELGVKYLDINSSNFSSYGSEKTGTPVKAFIRYAVKEKEIRVHSPVEHPDLLVVFHQALLKDKSVLKGCENGGTVIIALESGQNWVEGMQSWNCFGIEAQRIAMETHSRINVVMFGAALNLMGISDLDVGEKICIETLGKKYPDALEGNLEGMRRGYHEVRKLEMGNVKEDEPDESFQCREEKFKFINTTKNSNPQWGYANAPIGGINPRIGSTAIADLSPSRQGYIPLFIKEKCINCGQCYATCPDMVFQFKKGEYKGREMMINEGLDYYHCKGCLRCVNVCPVNALVRGVEAEQTNKDYFVANKELISIPNCYEESGADGYITSESYLTEKRMEGGEV